MRRLLLLTALCMAAVLAFAPMAAAQSSSASPGAEQTPDSPCPTDIDEFPLGTQCGEGGGYIVPDGGSVAPVITADSSFEECDGGPSVETPDGTRCLPDASADATAEADDESGTAPATAEADDEGSASASALPETGGVVSPAAISVAAALLLAGGGIMSASIARRR